MAEHVAAYVAKEQKPALPPPPSEVGVFAVVRKNLFATPVDAILTTALAVFVIWVVWNLAQWMLVSAVFTGQNREACVAAEGTAVGACWAFVRAKLGQFMGSEEHTSELQSREKLVCRPPVENNNEVI